MSLNRVVLVGRLVADPDLRYTQNGTAVANFRLAVNRPFTNGSGERDADYINGVIWRKAAESLANYMKKGSQIGVDGRIQTRTYDDKDGKTVYVTEVVAESVQFLESKGGGDKQQKQKEESPYDHMPNNDFANDGKPIDISSDDLPF